MGKGGRSAYGPGGASAVDLAQHVVADSPLADRPTSELRKHAEQRGLKADGTRDELILALHPFSKAIAHPFPAPKPLPLSRPPFKFTDLQKAVPRHCFKRDLATSAFHLATDLALVATFGYLATFICHANMGWAEYLLWPLYWFVQGTQMTGVWVIAHECGHQAFSESKTINNLVGLVCHSALLVPYHSWRITHAKHHNNTGSCENDEVFCPSTRSESKKSPTAAEDITAEMVQEAPLMQAIWIIIMLTFGWMPGYLCFNATGPAKYRDFHKSHFNPWAKMFEERDRMDVVVSDIGFFLALGGIFYAVNVFGLATVAKFYIAPYMITNAYLVLITFLQHTDVFLPHFRGSEWDWFRGALCTVDRSFGGVIDHVIHHISDTHVCHHMFSKMPFYHAQEATEHIRAFLGEYYLSDPTPIPQALWRSYGCCHFVEDVGNTVFYQSH